MPGLRAAVDRRYQQWLDRRLPAAPACRLENRRLFIFPSGAGALYGALLVVLWLTATNFENNLVFGLTFLLAGLFVIAIFHTYGNLHGLELVPLRAGNGFAGQDVDFVLEIRNDGRRPREGIRLAYAGGETREIHLGAGERRRVRLPVPATRRGWLDPGRLTIASVYPLGLLRVWSHVRLETRALVYPRPVAAGPMPPVSPASSEAGGASVPGREEFATLESYRPGEPKSRIAWKHHARGLGLHTKQFTDPVDRRRWLDWDDFPGLDTEARLSRLCGAALAADTGPGAYGLRLPGQTIAPGSGRPHREQVLRTLALFGLPEVAR
ncbi:MAG: DUF58 domain-containing protein [Porticoccaceae bacterium]